MRKLLKSAIGLLAFTLLLLWGATGFAQAPVNTTLIGAEGVTITACSTTACTYQFGAGAKFNTVAGAKYPLVASCTSAASCALLGGDPVPNVAKSIYAVQQAAAYTVTVTVAGKPVPIAVPALPVVTPPPPLSTTQTLTCTATVTVAVTTPAVGPITLTGPLTFTCTPVATTSNDIPWQPNQPTGVLSYE